MSDLSEQEINILIEKYEKLISKTKNINEVKEYEFRLVYLKRYLDENISKENTLLFTKPKHISSTNIKVLCNDMLNLLGYKNSLYLKESEILSQLITDKFDWKRTHGECSNRLLSACIVSDILTYYNSKYDEQKLVYDYDIDVNKYFKYSVYIHKLLKKHYWKPKLCLKMK
jgi:hypothetical protein